MNLPNYLPIYFFSAISIHELSLVIIMSYRERLRHGSTQHPVHREWHWLYYCIGRLTSDLSTPASYAEGIKTKRLMLRTMTVMFVQIR